MESSTANIVTTKVYKFHCFDVTQQVFYTSSLCFAFVNIRPLLPGHVLVSPQRPVARLSQLTDEEAADLLITVKRVAKTLERLYQASALTIPLQDGFDAGQSVPHVHIHILPRKPADLDHKGGPDAIYDELEGDEGDLGAHLFRRHRAQQPKVDEETIPLRSDVEMHAEAEMLRHEMNLDFSQTVAPV